MSLCGSSFSLEDNQVLSNTASLVATGRGGGILLADVDGAPLTGNTIRGNVASAGGDGDGGGLYLSGSDVTLEDNLVLSNTASLNGVATGRGGGVFATQCNPRLVNNVVADNRADSEGSGLWFDGTGAQATLLHTTIADNHSSGQGVYVDGPTLLFTDTIIAGHATVGVTATAGSVVTMTHTLWHNNGAHTGGGGTFGVSHDVAGDPDPLFVNPSAWDYHLTASSPAVDAGINGGASADFEGDPRPTGSGYDLGADELLLVDVQLAPSRSGTASFGTTVYTHTLTNTGNYTDTFTLTYHSSQGWAQVAPGGPITLGQGAAQTVWVTLTVPVSVVSGTVETTVVTATSGGDATAVAAVTDTTVVQVWRVYAPLVLRDYGP